MSQGDTIHIASCSRIVNSDYVSSMGYRPQNRAFTPAFQLSSSPVQNEPSHSTILHAPFEDGTPCFCCLHLTTSHRASLVRDMVSPDRRYRCINLGAEAEQGAVCYALSLTPISHTTRASPPATRITGRPHLNLVPPMEAIPHVCCSLTPQVSPTPQVSITIPAFYPDRFTLPMKRLRRSLPETYDGSAHKRDVTLPAIPWISLSSPPLYSSTGRTSEMSSLTSSMSTSSVTDFPTVTTTSDIPTLPPTLTTILSSSTVSRITSSTHLTSSWCSSFSAPLTGISSVASSSMRCARTSMPLSTTSPGASLTLPLSSSTRLSSTMQLSLSSSISSSSSVLQTSVVTLTRFTSTPTLTVHSHSSVKSSPTTSIEPGVLSTNTSRGPNSFARNTAAIVGVAVAGAASIIIAVIATFLLCRRYRRRHIIPGASSLDALNYATWHPPLAGDDDHHYYTDMHHGLLTTSSQNHATSQAHTNDAASVSTEPLISERNIAHGANNSESGTLRPMGNTFGQGGSPIDYYAANAASYYPGHAYTTDTLPPSSWQGIRDGTSRGLTRDHGETNSSMSSVNVGSSSQGHVGTSTSSGHGLLPTRPKINSGLENLGGLLGRLRPAHPSIIIHRASSKFSSTLSFLSPREKSSDLPLVDSSSAGEPEGHIPLNGLWAAATTHPLPPQAPGIFPGTFDDLLTPSLTGRVASSEHSSSASLRDHVDYSRPIGGLVRNRVHSTPTSRTDDTLTLKETSSVTSTRAR